VKGIIAQVVENNKLGVGKLIVTENKKIKLILDRIIPISPQVIPLYLHIRNEKLKVLSVYKLSMIGHHT
jgi:hypothetical protein